MCVRACVCAYVVCVHAYVRAICSVCVCVRAYVSVFVCVFVHM